MRGADEQSGSMFSYVSLEERVPADHPLRAIRRITDRALEQLSPRFGALYIHFGRPSIPPEKLLRALLLQALYTIRSERQLMEQLDYNLLFRWFVGLGMDDAVWSPTTFTQESRSTARRGHRRGVLRGSGRSTPTPRALAVGRALHRRRHLAGGVGEPQEFPPARSGAAVGRRRESHGQFSWSAPDAIRPINRRRIPTRGCIRKPAAARRASGYLGHVLMEHRSGLIVRATVTPADGHGERASFFGSEPNRRTWPSGSATFISHAQGKFSGSWRI